MGSDPYLAILAELVAERSRLDGLLDEALQQFAAFEDEFNLRLEKAAPHERAALMEERAQLESTLAVDELVERIDRVRERIAMLRTEVGDAAAA